MAADNSTISFRPAALRNAVLSAFGLLGDDTCRLVNASPAIREDLGLTLRDLRALGA